MTGMSQISRKVGFYALLGYFFSSTFSHALAQNFLALALLAGIMIFFGEKKFLHRPKFDLFLLAVILYLGWSMLSALFSPEPVNSLLSLREEWLFLMIPAAAYFLSDEKSIKTALIIFAVSSILIGGYAIWQHFSGLDLYRGVVLPEAPSFGYRVSGTFSHRLTFGIYFATAAVLFLGFIPFTTTKRIRIIFLSAFLISALAAFFTYSRGVIAVLIIATAGLMFYFGRRNILLSISLLAILSVILLFTSPDIFSRYIDSAEVELKGEYAASRISVWRTAGRMIEDHPILGVGPGNFKKEFINYRDEKSGRIFSHAHNDALDVAARAGMPAALFFLAFWGAMFRKMLDFLKDKCVKNTARGIALGLLAATAVFFVTSIFEASFADEEIRLLLMALWGMFMALSAAVKRRTESAETIEKA